MSIRKCVGAIAFAALSAWSLAACTSSSSGTSGAAATVQAATTSGGTASSDSAITFHNSSRWAIMRIHMSPVSQTTWGPDHLGANILSSGGSFTLHGVPCDSYDLKLVDQDNDECILHNVNICAENSGWDISDDDLLTCQAFTRAAH